jgi:Ca2+-binding EF-hand superfamily protein
MRVIPLATTFLLVAATAEAGSNVKALGKQFRKLDANRDELLTTDEFAKLLSRKLTKNNALAETQAEMFAWFDEDASEGIDLAEWLEAQTNTDSGRPYFSDAVIDELDSNGNGKLTWKEFSRIIPKYVSSKRARGWFDSITSVLSTGSSLSMGSSVSFGSSGSYSGGTLSIVDFGGYDISAQTGTYNLFDFVTGAGNFDVVTVDGNSLTYNGGTD